MRLMVTVPQLFMFVIVAWMGVCVLPAHAYLDPGTGSFFIQLVIGTMLAGVATMKLWWAKVVSMIKPKSK